MMHYNQRNNSSFHTDSTGQPGLYHLSSKKTNLLRPLTSRLKSKNVLELGCGSGILTLFLGELECRVTALEKNTTMAQITAARAREMPDIKVIADSWENFRSNEQFDVILLTEISPTLPLLQWARSLLLPNGFLVTAVENKTGLNKWTSMDPPGTDMQEPAAFSKKELESLLSTAGFPASTFLYPFPDHRLPEIILTDHAFSTDGFNIQGLLSDKISGSAIRFLREKELLPALSDSFLVLSGARDLDMGKNDRILGYYYNSDLQKYYCKQNTFILHADGSIEVTRSKMYENAKPPAARITQQLHDEPYYKGRLLTEGLAAIVGREGWTIKDLSQWTDSYYQILKACDTDNDGLIDGRFLDLSPFNIIIRQENDQPVIFDQEWVTDEKLPLHFILFRGLVYSLAKQHSFTPPAAGTPLQLIDLAKVVVNELIPFSEKEWEDCIRLEEDYFSSLSLIPGRTFGHGPLKIEESPLQQLARKNRQLAEKDQLLDKKDQQLTEKEYQLAEANRLLNEAENNRLTMVKEHESLLRLLRTELRDTRTAAEANCSVRESLERTVAWYQRTYEDRSFAGVIKEKAARTLRRKYRSLLSQLLKKKSIRQKFVLSFALESIKKQGIRAFLSMYMQEVRKRGAAALLSPRKTLLSHMLTPATAGAGETGPIADLLSPKPDREKINAEIQTFSVWPKISLIIPTYNTQPSFLKKAIESIRSQIYPNWEICIADDHSQNRQTLDMLHAYSRDPKIRILFGAENKGISETSNAAIQMAVGEYIALVDHDDEITPDALFLVAREINEKGETDILYSDECKVTEDGQLNEPFFKPDWSPELLLNMMYPGHLTVYRKEFLLKQVGLFRKEFDFSQDYDLMLRATEKTDRIRHIPNILYHWRQTEGSAAIGGKPFARKSNLAALRDALSRRNIPAVVQELPTANRVRLQIDRQPRVSVIIPTDSAANLAQALSAIRDQTDYPRYEIVVVTNSPLIQKMKGSPDVPPEIKFVAYDKPYNFSDKCNHGASESTGEVLIFFNDDVRPLHKDWIWQTIEYLFLPGVGGVSPRLVYENDTLQYAGMATGVRNLVGTTFHCQPRGSTAYFNFPQLVRDVAVLSGACLAIKKDVFESIGGFDAVYTPSSHSDVDLSFKLRQQGLRCLYNPYAILRHIGHLSLTSHERSLAPAAKDKADIFLLQNWTKLIAEDPYFTEPMRRWLYKDSPEAFRLYAPEHQPHPGRKGDILVISHDLTCSGAPIMLLEACRFYVENGYFVCLACRQDGPLRKDFLEAGIPVMVDSLVLEEHPSLVRFARNFDRVIANTIVAWPVIRQLQDLVPTIWWLHEGALLDSLMTRPDCASTLRLARKVIGVSEYAIRYIKKYNPHPRLIRLGCRDWRTNRIPPAKRDSKKTIFSLIASIEPRKGQDILVEALSYVPADALEKMEIWLIGRSLDKTFAESLAATIEQPAIIRLLGERSRDECLNLMDQSDVILCPSRDDPFPVVAMEAFSLSKPCILSTSTGTCELVHDRENGLIFDSEDARGLARVITWTLANTALLPGIGEAARRTFEEYLTLSQYQQTMLALLEEENKEEEHTFITSDGFIVDDHICHRQQIAAQYLKGTGIEIGALHKPLTVDPNKASVLYVDYKSREENRTRYPELVAAGETIVNTDIIDDGFLLKSISDTSLDFVIANHALEHSPDPLGTLSIWSDKLRPSGILYVTVPIADRCYDRGRPITSLQHFRQDHLHFLGLEKEKLLAGAKAHILEFITISGRNIAAINGQQVSPGHEQQLFRQLAGTLEDAVRKATSYEELMNAHVMRLNRVYDIHYHTFSPTSYEAFLRHFCTWKGLHLENVLKNGSGECIGIIRKN